MDAGEQAIALDYARNALAQVPRRSRRAAAVAAWLARYQDALGLAPVPAAPPMRARTSCSPRPPPHPMPPPGS